MPTILNTDHFGIHRPSLNKDFKVDAASVIEFFNNSSAVDRSSFVNNGNGTFTYTDHTGAVTFNVDVRAAAITIADTAGNFTATNVEAALAELFADIAAAAGVSSDANNSLTVGADGKPYFDHNNPSVTGVQVGGKIIATHNNGYGTVVNIRETVTAVSYNSTTKILSHTNENGTVTQIDLSELAVDVFVNGGTLSSTGILTLTDNSGVTPNITIDLNALTGELTNNNNGTFTYTDLSGPTVVRMLSANAGNSATFGTDGGVYFSIGDLDPLP